MTKLDEKGNVIGYLDKEGKFVDKKDAGEKLEKVTINVSDFKTIANEEDEAPEEIEDEEDEEKDDEENEENTDEGEDDEDEDEDGEESEETESEKRSGTFEVFKDAAGDYRFNLKAANNQIIAVSQGYKSRESCLKGIASVQRSSEKAVIKEIE